MLPEYTTQQLKCLPSAAVGVTITPVNSAWANSAWAVITASSAEAITFWGVAINPGVAADFEIDIGTGGSGAEVVAATVAGGMETNTNSPMGWELPIGVLVGNIASGTRIVVRLRKSGVSTTAWTCKLIYLPSVTDMGVTAQVPFCTPAAAAMPTAAGSGTAWVNSSWAVLSASVTPGAVLALAINAGIAADFECDIGQGGSGAEVAVATVGGTISSLAGLTFTRLLPIPIELLGTAQRITARVRKSGTSTANWAFKLVSLPVADLGSRDHARTNSIQKVAPTSPSSPTDAAVTAGSGTAWANSAYMELITSTAAAILLGGMTHYHYGAGVFEWENDIATGSAGSETVKTTFGSNREGSGHAPMFPFFANYNGVAASTRVASRMRKSGTSTSNLHNKMTYMELPLT